MKEKAVNLYRLSVKGIRDKAFAFDFNLTYKWRQTNLYRLIARMFIW